MQILTKAQITHIKQLQDNKYRKEFGVYVAEGEKILAELVKEGQNIDVVYSTEPLAIAHTMIPEAQMAKISSLHTPSKVLAIVQLPVYDLSIEKTTFYLLLDGVQDPGNLGTIIRIADWYNIKKIICSMDTADAYASKVVQASMGSIARVQVLKCDLQDFLKDHPSVPCYAALLQGQNLTTMDAPKGGFIIMGSEGKGIRPQIIKPNTTPITIAGFGNCESLNVAVACGIICSHFIK